MPRQPWIADAIRAEARRLGVDDQVLVREVSGWKGRGSTTFNPRGVTVHHDASHRNSGRRGALNIIIHGRAGLPGPLSQLQIERQVGNTCTIWVVAAGRANHAGRGGFRGLQFNSSVLGIEAANNGQGEPWGPVMILAYQVAVRALLRGIGRDYSWAHGHKEWATPVGRKVDPRGDLFTTTRHINPFRASLGKVTPSKPVVEPDLGDRVLTTGDRGGDVADLQALLNEVIAAQGDDRSRLAADGVFGPITAREVVYWGTEAGLTFSDEANPRVGSTTLAALRDLREGFIVRDADKQFFAGMEDRLKREIINDLLSSRRSEAGRDLRSQVQTPERYDEAIARGNAHHYDLPIVLQRIVEQTSVKVAEPIDASAYERADAPVALIVDNDVDEGIALTAEVVTGWPVFRVAEVTDYRIGIAVLVGATGHLTAGHVNAEEIRRASGSSRRETAALLGGLVSEANR